MRMVLRFTKIAELLVLVVVFSLFETELNGQLSAAQSYARIRPGVVMIKTNFTATIYLRQVIVDNRLFNVLLDSINQIEKFGAKLDAEEKLDIVLKQISNRPGAFFKSTKDYRYHTQTITTSGTGFIITDNGYVVTNCHVVDESGSYIRRKFILSGFQQVTETNINALEAAWGVQFTEEQKESLYSSFEKIYSSIQSIFLENLKKTILVTYATDTANMHPPSKTTVARVIIKGQSMPGKDVAILKLEPAKNFPTLNLANITVPRIGDRVYVFGYPDVVTRNKYLAAESVQEPSITEGIVSGIRKTITGWNVMQMDADINRGNSGGPVCDEKGNVIGISTFGSIDYGSGTLAAGMNFSVPVNIINEFIDSSGIRVEAGKLTVLYNKAMDDYDKEEYRDALSILKKVQKTNPHFPGLSFYIESCNEKISNGLDKTEKNVRFSIVLAALIISLLIIVFMVRARQKAKTLVG